MRYLVEWKLTPIPPEHAKTALALAEATKAWVEKGKKAGSLVEVWSKTEGMGGIVIAEAESNDALYRKQQECPLIFFMSYCVTPLTDFKLMMETGKSQLKQMIKG